MTTIPTTSQLYTSFKSALEAEYGTTISIFGKVFIRAIALVYAAKMKLFYLQIGALQKNLFVDTADRVSAGGTLERFGLVMLGRNPFTATQGQYEIQVTGTVGATIPAQTTFKSDDNSQSPGKLFILDTAFTLATTPDTITVRALEAGLDSRLTVANTLTATAPLVAVNSSAVVLSEVTIPLEAEDIEDYRNKTIQAFRLEPQGGAPADYRSWGYDAQGVQQIYPYASSGNPNEVDVYVEATIADSTDGKGTPTSLIMDDVEACIELSPDTTLTMEERSRRPMGVWINIYPIDPIDVDINIPDFVDLTTAKQATILAALTELLAGIRPFIPAADAVTERADVLSTNLIASAVLAALPGSLFSPVELTVNGNPVVSYLFDLGEIPHLNTVTYV